MRDILFRVWDIEAKKMRHIITDIHWALHGITGCKYILNEIDGGTLVNDADCVGGKDGFILMQYTGLKDKNKKEIYDGDLVKISNHKCQLQLFEAIGRVTERYSAWGVTDLRIIKFEKYSPKTKPQDATDIMYFLNIFDHKHIEIIGTIHTTPKLLEKSK